MTADAAARLFAPAVDAERSGAWSPSSMPTVPRGERSRTRRTGFSATPWGVAPVGRAMTRRRPALVWVAALLTLGVSHLVWYGRIHREMAAFDRRADVPTLAPVLVMALLWPTVVAPLVSVARAARRVAEAQRGAGLLMTCRPAPAVLLALVPGLHTVYLQSQLNRVADAYRVAPGSRVALRD